MPAFVKLVKGAGRALRQMQEELGAAAPEERLAFPGAPGALTLYHGSPHGFDSFDFENNLRRGEGAMAYGPGGYMTGNRPLAEHYARSLFTWHNGRGGAGLQSPYDAAVGGRKIAGNLGSLNSYFLETLGDSLARDDLGNLASMGARRRSKYSLSMDSSLDPWTGNVVASADGPSSAHRQSTVFAPGQTRADTTYPVLAPPWASSVPNQFERAGPAYVRNPHGTLSGMLAEDKNATLRYLQFKEALRAMDRGIVDGLGNSGLKDVLASPGWAQYAQASDDIDLPDSIRMGVQAYGGKRIPKNQRNIDWRLTPRTADQAMAIGETLQGRLDPHLDLRLMVDRPRRAPTPGEPSGKAPWLYTADYEAGPNDMLLYDAPFKDQSSRVQGALNDLFTSGELPHNSALLRSVGSRGVQINPDATGSQVVRALPQDLSGMMTLKEAGIPATAYLRAGPRTGGLGLNFNPDDFNFVIHDQSLLDNLRKERLK